MDPTIDYYNLNAEYFIENTQNGISRVVQSYFYEMTNAEDAAFGVKNCQILRYDFE